MALFSCINPCSRLNRNQNKQNIRRKRENQKSERFSIKCRKLFCVYWLVKIIFAALSRPIRSKPQIAESWLVFASFPRVWRHLYSLLSLHSDWFIVLLTFFFWLARVITMVLVLYVNFIENRAMMLLLIIIVKMIILIIINNINHV